MERNISPTFFASHVQISVQSGFDVTTINVLSHCAVHKVRWRGSTLTSTLQSRTSVSRSTKDANNPTYTSSFLSALCTSHSAILSSVYKQTQHLVTPFGHNEMARAIFTNRRLSISHLHCSNPFRELDMKTMSGRVW